MVNSIRAGNRLSKMLMVGSIGLAILITDSPAFAGIFDQIPNPLKSSTQAPVTSANDLNGKLTAINVRFALSMGEMLTAQSYTLAALGDKAKADELTSEAKSLQGANDINTVSRCVSVSEDASKEIDDKMSSSAVIDAHSKETLSKAVPHYGAGMLQAAHLGADYAAWVSSAKATASSTGSNPMGAVTGSGKIARQMYDVLKVTESLPDLISTWSDTTHNFIKFSNTNGVDTGDLSSKI